MATATTIPVVNTNNGMPLGDALQAIILHRNAGRDWADVARYVQLPWQTCYSLYTVAGTLGHHAK